MCTWPSRKELLLTWLCSCVLSTTAYLNVTVPRNLSAIALKNLTYFDPINNISVTKQHFVDQDWSDHSSFVSFTAQSPQAIPCAPGAYKSNGNPYSGQDYCVLCTCGKYQDSWQSSRPCQECQGGTYGPCDSLGRGANTQCTACQAGTTAPEGSSACTFCAQGRYSLAQDANCYDCPKGKYQNAAGQSSCLACNQNNQYQDQTGQSTCKLCRAAEGYERLPTSLGAGSTPFSPGYTGCSKCEDSWYLNDNTKACERCPDNYVTDVLNNHQSCESCLFGKYRSNSQNMGQCETCPSGYQAISNDPFGCAICPAGKYQTGSSPSDKICKPCPINQYSDADGQSSCKPCPANSAAPSTGATICVCQIGYEQKNGQCQPCSYGQYGTINNNQYVCTRCPFSKTPPGPNTDRLITLGVGSPNVDSCVGCPLGYKCIDGKELGKCPLDHYPQVIGNTGNVDCVKCPNGMYTVQTGSTGLGDCMVCGKGYELLLQRTINNSIPCVACTAGRFNQEGDSTLCVNCPQGKYNDKTGAINCADCPLQTYGLTMGQTNAKDSCIPCPKGTYTTKAGQQSCEGNCPGAVDMFFFGLVGGYSNEQKRACPGGAAGAWGFVAFLAIGLIGGSLIILFVVVLWIWCVGKGGVFTCATILQSLNEAVASILACFCCKCGNNESKSLAMRYDYTL